ncbi:TCP family transcription factor [Striga asiatica]|uniref:TCP family transcription factor n=1 Tax=Striga asiatica TaxID=4170 RepID=A0A5A7QZP8_STRAF|nr:TCP family transcription factor [Striga asiatica]
MLPNNECQFDPSGKDGTLHLTTQAGFVTPQYLQACSVKSPLSYSKTSSSPPVSSKFRPPIPAASASTTPWRGHGVWRRTVKLQRRKEEPRWPKLNRRAWARRRVIEVLLALSVEFKKRVRVVPGVRLRRRLVEIARLRIHAGFLQPLMQLCKMPKAEITELEKIAGELERIRARVWFGEGKRG